MKKRLEQVKLVITFLSFSLPALVLFYSVRNGLYLYERSVFRRINHFFVWAYLSHYPQPDYTRAHTQSPHPIATPSTTNDVVLYELSAAFYDRNHIF